MLWVRSTNLNTSIRELTNATKQKVCAAGNIESGEKKTVTYSRYPNRKQLLEARPGPPL